MTTTALIMAGGHGTRMRTSGVTAPKPLVPVLAVSLLERNLQALARHGVGRIALVVPHDIPELVTFADVQARAFVGALGSSFEMIVEDRPLGNIGGAGRFAGRTDALLVVYADNLTTLDLAAVADAHAASGADLTLATHLHQFRMPFGEVQVENGEVRGYLEKPTYSFPVSSAITVLGARALAALPGDRPTGLSELARNLIQAGGRVREFRHDAPWIDVNDALARAEAARLILTHQRDFDLWLREPADTAEILLVQSAGSMLMLPPSDRQPFWSLPILRNGAHAGETWVAFDDLDHATAAPCRFRIARRPAAAVAALAGATWRAIADVEDDPAVDRLARRVAALIPCIPDAPG